MIHVFQYSHLGLLKRIGLLEIALRVRGSNIVPCVRTALAERDDVLNGCSKQVRESALRLNLLPANMARPPV